ncbi:AAA family ATPase [Polaribacter dokdonensis]|uniref:AAA ATPase n=1 Tax=Polaribacter dokdonensis DSW-5 TaxID=1300348 RepID=A0A0N0CFE7_9FLAO|nr:AAA family ATPase [Polaribacter dokdonensis]KOY51688.1 AAA ATPase [Polaribacter dokdonensis DSW-5]SEE05491.1 AAA domain-containing protein [Polaribacter dokdonensis DSW-5]
MEIRKSNRKKTKIKLAIQGSAGSGKTYSSLLLAKGLVNGQFSKVAVIDTENNSADLYAHLGDYNVVSLEAPYSPEKYIKAIELCEKSGMEVIIIDSTSHCWDYLLDVHSNMSGNSFANWAKITPRQNAFINKILSSDANIISTMRVKQDYVISQKNGKMIPEKVGLKAIQRNDVDYEFTIVFDIDIAHNCKASKDRTGVFVCKPEFKINEETGTMIKEWCSQESGNSRQENIEVEIEECTSLEALRHVYSKYPELQNKILPSIMLKKSELENLGQSINNT